jgi:beta-phosphoglucomutase
MRDAPRAVIFDFDGVLVDSEPLHEWAIRASVAPLGWEFSTEAFYASIVGRGDENAYRKIAEWNGAGLGEARLRGLLKDKWALMDRGIAEGRFTVQPGAREAVEAARAVGPVGVCSGSVRPTVVAMLRAAGLYELLETVVCLDDVGVMKPAPDGYLRAAANLGVEPGACLAVEDTPTGVRAARNAGMRVVAVCHTVGPDDLREADLVVDRITQVPLGGWAPARGGRGGA